MGNKPFASLCILAYKRPEMLSMCLDSIHRTIDYPCEVIVNLDGGDVETRIVLEEWLHLNKISKLIMNGGENRGVGRSFQQCLGVAEGDYIFKIDADLQFKPKWLSTAIHILDTDNAVSAISLFNYNHYDPKDTRFKILEERANYYTVSDFVSSVYGVRGSDLLSGLLPVINIPVDTVPDDGLHEKMKRKGILAITKEDFVTNTGFGEKSVYVSFDKEGNPYKTETHNTPLIFDPLTV